MHLTSSYFTKSTKLGKVFITHDVDSIGFVDSVSMILWYPLFRSASYLYWINIVIILTITVFELHKYSVQAKLIRQIS